MNKLVVVILVALGLLIQAGWAGDSEKDKTMLQSAPVQVSAKCDKKEYTHGEPGVRYVIAPTGKLKATLTVKNVSDKTQTLEFRSGQKYDFVIRDAKGRELQRWSADKGFAMMIQEIELLPGQQETFSEELLLGDVGKPLPEGDYVLEGILTCQPPIAARVPFKIVPTLGRKIAE